MDIPKTFKNIIEWTVELSNEKILTSRMLFMGKVLIEMYLEDISKPCMQVILSFSCNTELFLLGVKCYHMPLLQVQPPCYIEATSDWDNPSRSSSGPEFLLGFVVLEFGGVVGSFPSKHEVLPLHRLQLPKVALTHGGARACAPARHASAATCRWTLRVITLKLFTNTVNSLSISR